MARTANDTRMSRKALIGTANEIIAEYLRDHDMKITLRQLYYQFVARGHIANEPKEYKRLKDATAFARWEGIMPIDGLEDRGRTSSTGEFTKAIPDLDFADNSAAAYVRSIPSWAVDFDRWSDQAVHLSVMFEKQALLPVFERVCNARGVCAFAFKGYPSIGALHEWFMRTADACDPGYADEWSTSQYKGGRPDPFSVDDERIARRAVILYYGDHDPEGLDIPRAAAAAINRLMELTGRRFEFTFERMGLSTEQIAHYALPPMLAKPSSSRFKGYAEAGGDDFITKPFRVARLRERLSRFLEEG